VTEHGVSISTDLARGTELAGYRIDALLGRGGMSVVYLAEDLRLKRKVALKLLAPRLAEDEGFREQFLEESELAASLDHPNIVPVYEAGEADERLFIAMRYVEGSDLKELLRDGPLAPERALTLVSQVGAALDAAHLRGLIHGDVKPSNVLLAPGAGPDGSDHAYLADFGLTRRIVGGSAAAREGGLAATIDYVAPEQIRGDEVDGRADVYSLGCLLHECLTGEPPFPRGSDAAVLFAHLQEEPLAAPGLEEVLARALAKSPNERYGTCRELVEAARATLGIAEPTRRRWPLALASVGIASIGAAVLAFFLTQGGGAPALAGTGRVVRIDLVKSGVGAAVSVGGDPTGTAVGGGYVWVTTLADSTLWRIDAKTRALKRIPANGSPAGGVAATKAGIYIGNGNSTGGAVGNVTRFDTTSGAQLSESSTGAVSAIAAGRDGIWVALPPGDAGGRYVGHIGAGAPYANGLLARLPLPARSTAEPSRHLFEQEGIAVGEHAVWVLGDVLDPELWRVDPQRNRITRAGWLGFAPGGVAAGAGAVWVTEQLNDRVARIDPATSRIVATVKVGREPIGVAVGAGGVWVANTIDRTVMLIDPTTNRVVRTIRVALSPKAIAVNAKSVWVAGDAP
jgi:YVTN family beta-propeller protein